jgi:N6-adenosine-specific RNA methylase IME4
MTLDEIKALPVARVMEPEAYLFLWTTNRYLEAAFDVARAWRFVPRQTIVWCKQPMGDGPGGMFATTTEFVVIAQRIGPASHARGKRTLGKRIPTSWFQWPRGAHSQKPEAFTDIVETVAPGPYLELFARRRRLGWSVWGNEVGYDVNLEAVS